MLLVTEHGLKADSYRRTEDASTGDDIVVPLDTLADHADHRGRLGAEVPNTARIEELRPWLDRLDLIALPFPAFTDGRAYSLARQIRQDGFRGQLRASGNVLPDQLQFMAQVGFDAFEVSDRFSADVWQKALSRLNLSYQGATAGARHVWQERLRARADVLAASAG